MSGEVLDKFSQLITTALGLVAALAGQFLYAALITLVVIFATIAVGRAAEKAKKDEAEQQNETEPS